MGITIHYSGTLKSRKSLEGLIEEAEDVASAYGWKTTTFEKKFPLHAYGKKDFDKNLYGIFFSPPDCEPVSLSFLSNGKLVSLANWEISRREGKKVERTDLYGFTKTQFAGPEIHKILIHFLDHLSKKYFRSFKMIDDARYWETRDEKLLEKNFEVMTGILNSVTTELKNVPLLPGESFEKYFERILKKIHEGRKK